MRRSTSLNNDTATAIVREIDSKYDNVKTVADNMATIEKFTDSVISDLNTIASDLPDITTVTEAQALIDNLTATVTGTLPAGQDATVTLNGTTLEFQLPQGANGTDGADGVNGTNGTNGTNGQSAYQLWLAAGNTGTVDDFLIAIKGATGATGRIGNTGATGAIGATGAAGQDLTIEQVIDNGDGTITFDFSDGTNFTTPDLTGPQGEQGVQGLKGDQGISLHHIKGTATTDPEGDFVTPGQDDTYTLYGDADETIIFGSITIHNGSDLDISPSTVKSLYESNLDTNAYNDVDKAKVDNIVVTQSVDLDSIELATDRVDAVTGDLVGSSDIQTLTNKTLTSPKLNEDVILNATSSEVDNLVNNLTVTQPIDLEAIPTAKIDVENKIGTITHIPTLDKVYNHMHSPGIVNGCDITDNLNGTINISAGECVIRATGSTRDSTLYSAEIQAATNLALTDNAVNFVNVQYNDGITLVWNVSVSPTTINMIDVIPAYVVVREGNKLTWRDARSQNVDHIAKNQIKEFYTETLKRKNGGSIISDAGTLHLACTAGAFFFQLNEIAVPALNTTGTDTFEYYKHVAGAWTETDAQVFDALNYDNGTDLVAVGNNNYGVHWVYAMVGSTSHYAVLYGNASYSNIASAQAATTPTNLPPSVEGLGYLLGRVITQSGDPEIIAIATTFNTTFQSTLATDHENLAGLLGGSVGDHMHLTTTEYNNLIALGTLAEFEASLVTGV